jgi:acetyl esterase
MLISRHALPSLIVLVLLPFLPAFAANGVVLQPIGSQAIVEDDFTYARAADVELRAHSYRPKAQGLLPAIIDVHGGAWSSGDRMQGAHYDRALASTGLYVLAIDFRQAPGAQHPAGNADIAAAVRYLRTHAARLEIDPASIGLVGSSSGGHLVMLAGLTPGSEEFRGTQISTGKGFAPADTVDAGVRYVIALWPVSDPEYRYEYAHRVGRAELIKSHEAYFGTRELMRRASVPRLLRAKEAAQLPPFMIVQPGNDANIPREMTFDLLNAYQDAGGRATYLFYPGERHAFGHRPSANTEHLVLAMRDYIAQSLAHGR